MKVPFLDLKCQYETIHDEISFAIREVFDNCAFAGGPFVEKFESNFKTFCGSSHAIGVGSGTDALWLALSSLGVGHGDEVITVPNTFIATAEAISRCGATPVFVDVDPSRYTLDPNQLEMAISVHTKAIIPVHLFGRMADMDPILEIARKNGLHVIEDACQAHGARYKGKRAGTLGVAGCFSFYPGKNLGAYGEAGAIVTDDAELAATIRILRDHGQVKKYHHSMLGWNSRMDGIQGAVLDVKLRHLESWNEKRKKAAKAYRSALSGIPNLILPAETDDADSVYHIFAVRVPGRDHLLRQLESREIYCGIHYPVPVHMMAAYRFLGYGAGSFPVSELCAEELLSLPMYPELTREQIEEVASALRLLMTS